MLDPHGLSTPTDVVAGSVNVLHCTNTPPGMLLAPANIHL